MLQQGASLQIDFKPRAYRNTQTDMSLGIGVSVFRFSYLICKSILISRFIVFHPEIRLPVQGGNHRRIGKRKIINSD
ncbi:hypothetical protein DSECCO2_589260 [anaerobic digester metagenome]